MGKYVIKFAGRQTVATCSKDAAHSLSAELSKLVDIANHCEVKSIHTDGTESTWARWAMYGNNETPPREPQEFERKRTSLFNSIPPTVTKPQVENVTRQAKELFNAHVAQVVEDHRKPNPNLTPVLAPTPAPIPEGSSQL